MADLGELPESPTTRNDNVILIETFLSEKIVEFYLGQENMHVEAYFPANEIYVLECHSKTSKDFSR